VLSRQASRCALLPFCACVRARALRACRRRAPVDIQLSACTNVCTVSHTRWRVVHTIRLYSTAYSIVSSIRRMCDSPPYIRYCKYIEYRPYIVCTTLHCMSESPYFTSYTQYRPCSSPHVQTCRRCAPAASAARAPCRSPPPR
jgi:hypothetical protein